MNDEAMSVDLGVITKPKMSIGYDKDKGVVVGFSFEADIAPSDLARILDAGKTTSLRAKIFTQAPPMLVTREGEQIGLGAAVPPVEHGIPVGKETATATLEEELGLSAPGAD
jgi:hypothetical protein